ncbi:HpcH/HpaI aldolase family protein [Microbacterium sp. RD1]|uniref:HpcH/HpaI aldolase family protein n=1 Tax=Microbacterium sp. RD1 TaxID=3457313 RepID=UPI003FA54C73
MTRIGYWLTDSNIATAEIVSDWKYDFVVLDLEHGMFGLETLNTFIPVLRGLGLQIFAKVLEPTQAAIQQPLDLGAHGVIVPHVKSAEHVEELASFAKYPPRGARSMAGGRLFGYGPWTNAHIADLDETTMFLPLIEDPRAVDDIERIAALPNVDGVQMGPGDLSLLSGRGALSLTDADWADINRCRDAVRAHGKPFLYPAWTPAEQEWAVASEVPMMLVGAQYAGVRYAVGQTRAYVDTLLARR